MPAEEPEGVLTDEELPGRTAAGERAVFETFVARHQAEVFRFARAATESAAAAEDVLEETFLVAWRAAGSFRGRSSVKTWLLTIARNQAWHHRERASPGSDARRPKGRAKPPPLPPVSPVVRPLRAVITVPDDDAGLMGRVKVGDPAGAEALFSRYAGPILGFTERMLGSRAEAEEVTQDVFLKMISRCEQYDGRASVSTWLFAIAANACRDRLRSAWRTTSVPLEGVPEPKGEGSIEGGLLEREKRRAVRAALERLTREQREALLLARYRGMPYAEVARTLGISEGAVKTRVFRAVETLRAYFAGEGGHEWTA